MTHHELAELLRDHVSHDEPPAPLPHPALSAGRRRLRARRLTTAGAVVAVLAVAGVVVGPRLGGDLGPDRAVDPVSVAALQEYDAHRMPQLMDEHVRQVLTASVPDLGPSSFKALDSQAQRLPEQYWDKASTLSVKFGTDEHAYAVAISHSRGEAEGDPERFCQNGLDEGFYLQCTVDRTDAGDVVIDLLWALKPMTAGNSLGEVATRDELDDIPLEKLTFERLVKVIKSESLVTYVSEDVQATDHDPASAAFVTPVEDLVAIGTDPELVMPEPPPGDNGCAQWSMPVEGQTVSCSGP